MSTTNSESLAQFLSLTDTKPPKAVRQALEEVEFRRKTRRELAARRAEERIDRYKRMFGKQINPPWNRVNTLTHKVADRTKALIALSVASVRFISETACLAQTGQSTWKE